jgi:hypothetical protein
MAYRLIIETVEGTIEQMVFAESKRKALEKADKIAIGVRILRRTVKEIF